jgi:hypothetical protein
MQNTYNLNFITQPLCLCCIKSVNHRILAIAEAHFHLLDKCVSMRTKIPLNKNWILNFLYMKTVQCKKNCNSYYNAWYYIQWSHKSQYVEVYELCLEPKMSCMAYEKVVIQLFYNFMNIPHCLPWKPKKFPSSFPVPRRVPYNVTAPVIAVHCHLQ